MLCFALRMNKNALLPCVLYDIPETVEAVADACREHYLEIGKPLANTTLEVAMKGYYWHDEENKSITCVLDKKEPTAKSQIGFDYATKVTIAEPLEMNTNVVITVNGRESTFTDLKTDFQNDGVEFPEDEWKGKFTEKLRGEPVKKKVRVESASSSAGSPSKPASSAHLSTALRKRLAEKTPDKNAKK